MDTMDYEGGPPVQRTNYVAIAVVVVVGLSVAMTFATLYMLTPPTVWAVEHHYSQSKN